MKQTTFQHPELRDANDNIIQEGTYGKASPLVNSTNDGVLDYINNNLEALYDAQTAAGNAITTGGLTVSGKTTTGTLEASSATVSGQTTTGTLAAGDTTVTGSITTTGLTVTGTTSVPTANAGNSSKAIANTAYVQGELTNYLPLSGGTMTGAITTSAVDFIKKTSNTSHVTLFGGTEYSNSASLMLVGGSQSYAPGYFELKALDGANGSVLAGSPDGTLTWCNKDVERVSAKGTYGIRFESGIQICWGTLPIPAGTSGREVSRTMTFPYPFANTSYGLTFGNQWCGSQSEYYRAEDKNAANFKFTAGAVGTNGHNAFYVAIGYWK